VHKIQNIIIVSTVTGVQISFEDIYNSPPCSFAVIAAKERFD